MPQVVTLRRTFNLYTDFAVKIALLSGQDPLPMFMDAETYSDIRSNSLSKAAWERLGNSPAFREIYTTYGTREARNMARESAIKHVLGFDPLEGLRGDKRRHFRAAITVLLTSLQQESEQKGLEYLNATMCPRVCNNIQFYGYENLVELPEYPRLPEDGEILSIGAGVFYLAYKALCESTD